MENIQFKTGTKLVQFVKCPASVWKVRESDGDIRNVYDTGVNTYCVAVFNDGNVIVGGDHWTGTGYTSKHAWLFTSNLSLIESYGIAFSNKGVCLDNKGYWYMTGTYIAHGSVYKMTESGHLVWLYDPAGAGPDRYNGVAVDSDGDVIGVGADVARGETVIKLARLTGDEIWDYQTNVEMHDVCVDSNDDICAVGFRRVGVGQVWKLSSAGALIWSKDVGANCAGMYGVAVDVDDHFYVAGDEIASGKDAWKLNGINGNILVSYSIGTHALGLLREGLGICVSKPGIATIESVPSVAGTGYNANEILEVTEGYGGKVKILTVGDTGNVLTLQITAYKAGGNYTTGADKVTSGGSGTGCKIEIAIVTQVFVYIVGARNTLGKNIWKFQNDGILVWASDTGGYETYDIALNKEQDTLYVTGRRHEPPP